MPIFVLFVNVVIIKLFVKKPFAFTLVWGTRIIKREKFTVILSFGFRL